MNTFEQAIAELDVYGFTLIPDVLNRNQVNALKQALISSSEEKGRHDYKNRGGTSLIVFNLPTLNPVFFRL